MVLILEGQPENYRPRDKFFYERRRDILPFDIRGQGSKILGQWKFEYILNKLGKLWKRQDNFADGHSVIIVPQINRGSHNNNHIIAITNNKEITRFDNLQTYYLKNRGLEKTFSNYQRIIRNELH